MQWIASHFLKYHDGGCGKHVIPFLNANIVYLCAESTETELRTVKHIIQSWK